VVWLLYWLGACSFPKSRKRVLHTSPIVALCVLRIFRGSLEWWDLQSVCVTQMSMMQSAAWAHRPQIKMSPHSPLWLFCKLQLTVGLASVAFISSLEWLRWIFGLLQTKEGVRAQEARSQIASRISLWCEMMRPPFLHSSTWQTHWQRSHNFAKEASGWCHWLQRRVGNPTTLKCAAMSMLIWALPSSKPSTSAYGDHTSQPVR
jgi:hypothetical protein